MQVSNINAHAAIAAQHTAVSAQPQLHVPSDGEVAQLRHSINDQINHLKDLLEGLDQYTNPSEYNNAVSDLEALETSSEALLQMGSIPTSDEDKALMFAQGEKVLEGADQDFPVEQNSAPQVNQAITRAVSNKALI